MSGQTGKLVESVFTAFNCKFSKAYHDIFSCSHTVITKILEPPRQKTHFCLFFSNVFLIHFLCSLAFVSFLLNVT